jgi:hypothetical protein
MSNISILPFTLHILSRRHGDVKIETKLDIFFRLGSFGAATAKYKKLLPATKAKISFLPFNVEMQL